MTASNRRCTKPGLLSEAERAALLTRWRHEFDRARDPAFFVCLGPGQFLDGDAAREAHHVWSDIPPALVEAWRTKEEPGPR
jgi:hypothetical protein